MRIPVAMRVGVLVVLAGVTVLLLGTACGGVDPMDLAPPDALPPVLAWETIHPYLEDDPSSPEPVVRPVPVREWRVEFSPSGTFRYAWRSLREQQAPWRQIAGTWKPCENPSLINPTWLLLTDGDPQHVDNEIMGGGDLPMVWWHRGGPSLNSGGAVQAPSWWIQTVDPDTGKFTDAFTSRTDPRLRGR